MSRIKLRGIKGRVYEPDPPPACERKHHCENCFQCHFQCQMCGDLRCKRCLGGKAGSAKRRRGKADRSK